MKRAATLPVELPSGTVTFLYSDIEASTRLWQKHGDAMPGALARHHAILTGAIEEHDGYIFQVVGDAFCAAFHRPTDALLAALQAQRSLESEPWNGPFRLRVRMGLHTGEAELGSDGDYRCYLTLSRIQRLMSVAHGGQLLLSSATEALIRHHLPADVILRDVGDLRLKDFDGAERAYQPVTPQLQSDFPALSGSTLTPTNLPNQLTSLVGRETEIAELVALLDSTRLLTLTGTGGVGKTRLSVQLAASLLESYPDGVWFIELAPLQNPDLLPETIAAVLAIREEPGRSILSAIGEYLKNRRSMLVLDNCEHLIEACAQVADTILRAAPSSRILATSREALGIGGETTYRVPSLSTPAAESDVSTLMKFDSVRLFIDRAKAARPGYEFNADEFGHVREICRQLDGIPLAVELAAVRVKSMSVAQIASHLGKRTRFQLLASGSRAAMSRHQTLRSLIDWSHGLLPESEKILLRRLSVFAGGWSAEAAERVCSESAASGAPATDQSGSSDDPMAERGLDILGTLSRLVDKSLVVLDDVGKEPRYRMLEMIRQYAHERLLESGEADGIRNRHLRYYLEHLETIEPRVYGPEQVLWLNCIELDHANLRRSCDWSIDNGQWQAAYRFSWSLLRYWEVRSRHTEGLDFTMRALGRATSSSRTAARGRALGCAAALHFHFARFGEARTHCDDSIRVCREAQDKLGLSFGLLYSALLSITEGDLEAGRSSVLEARALYPSSPENSADAQKVACGTAFLLALLGDVKRSCGEIEQAAGSYGESVEMLRRIGDRYSIAYPLRRRAYLLLLEENWTAASELAMEGLEANLEIGDPRGALMCIGVFVAVAMCRGANRRAARLAGCIAHLFNEISDCMMPLDQLDFDALLVQLRERTDPDTFEASRSAGRTVSFEQVVAEARSIAVSIDELTPDPSPSA